MVNISYNGYTPEVFGAWLANRPVITHSEIKRHSWEVPMHDGLYYADDSYRGDATIELLIHMKNDNWLANIRPVRKWLSQVGTLRFLETNDSHFEVKKVNLTEETRQGEDYGRIRALMTIYPYEFLDSGNTPVSASPVVNNYDDSLPLIKITGTAAAEGTLSVGSGRVTFKMPSEGNLYIDVRNMVAYSVDQNNHKVKADNAVNGDYEYLKISGSTTISISSGFSWQITPRWGYYQ